VVAGGQYHYLYMECVAAGGDRAPGICTAQLLALLDWVRSHSSRQSVDIHAEGFSCGLIALCTAALQPKGIGAMRVNVPDTLRRLIDWDVEYAQNHVIFCFGLPERFDIHDLIILSDPVRIEMDGRGPMRSPS